MIAFNILARRQRLRRHRILAVRYQTTLHWTAKQGRVEAVDMMVRAGMNVNIRLVSDRRGDRWCQAVQINDT
ncbi:hypothetical protein J4Q44_G00388970 [Coregonus suidteri]|uniref:Uncharacterized protein n=1 Tax=Coregonus suidteri TaxID=861788 RepID=A0AAN8Q3V2_9TELE